MISNMTLLLLAVWPLNVKSAPGALILPVSSFFVLLFRKRLPWRVSFFGLTRPGQSAILESVPKGRLRAMADNNDLQILVKDILEGVGSMLDQHKKETLEEIRASENRTRMLIEAQDKKISAIAEQVGSLGNRMGKVENRLDKIENRLDTLESDVKVVKDLAVDYEVDLTPHWFRHIKPL